MTLRKSANDDGGCIPNDPNRWLKWLVIVDEWADGTPDYAWSSFVATSASFGTTVTVAPGVTIPVKYLAPSKPKDNITITFPNIIEGKHSYHKVTYKVTDGCHNFGSCTETIEVKDKKAPTPYCVSVRTALMQTTPKMVELWARDFDKGAFDNCTPQSKLYFTFDEIAPIYTRVNEEHFYKASANGSVNATAAEYAQGKAYKWLPASRTAGKVWTAKGVYSIKVSVWDEAWNTDYCTIELTILDNSDAGLIAGTVSSENNVGIKDIEVVANANLPEYPKATLTNVNGEYTMPIYVSTEVNAHKVGDDLNGVSTLDLVLIQRHILGIQNLNSPYKLIAADANNDAKVTASDLTEIRKLVLGVTSSYPNNTSWRFPVKGQNLSLSNPFPYVEKFTVDANNTSGDFSFYAVKIGDVNSTVVTNLHTAGTDTRSNFNVEMSVADVAVAAGEVVEIPVTAASFSEVSGFQYTMNLNGASFVGVNGGTLEMTGANVGVIANDVVTMSYASNEAVSATEGAVLFTIVVKADKAMNVSEMIGLSSEVTRAESYNNDLKVGNVSLSVRTAPVTSIELFQNEPNPFKGQTTVTFNMPEAAAATMSVYDVTGKVLMVRNIAATKGMNSEVFTREQLGVSGVLYYTLVSGDFTAIKKMIIIE